MNETTTASLKKLWQDNAYPSTTPRTNSPNGEAWTLELRTLRLGSRTVPPRHCFNSVKNRTLWQVPSTMQRNPWNVSTLICGIGVRTHRPMGNNYLMIAVDSFTRKAWAEPMKSNCQMRSWKHTLRSKRI